MIDMEDQQISEEATRLAADPAFAQKFEDVPGEPPLRRVRHCVADMRAAQHGCDRPGALSLCEVGAADQACLEAVSADSAFAQMTESRPQEPPP